MQTLSPSPGLFVTEGWPALLLLLTAGAILFFLWRFFRKGRRLQRKLTESKVAREALEQRADFAGFITGLATKFINLPTAEIDRGIVEGLENIGRFAGADRSFLFKRRSADPVFDCIQAWSAPGIAPRLMGSLTPEDLPIAWKRLEQDQIFDIADSRTLSAGTNAAPGGGSEAALGRSLLLVPLATGDGISGLIGLASVQGRRWPDENIRLLRLAGQMFVNALMRKQTEEALRKSEMRYRSVVEDQVEFIVRWLPDGTRTFVNAAYCKHVGLPLEQCIGRNFLELIPEEDQPTVRRAIASLTPESPHFVAEHRMVARNGQIRWMRWSDRAVFDADGNITEINSVGLDITDRKQAENALQESQKFLESIYLGSASAIAVVDVGEDRAFRYVGINPACERILGVTSAEVCGKTPEELIPVLGEETVQDVLTDFTKCLETGEPYAREVKQRVGEREYWFYRQRAPICGADGRIVRIVSSAVDITEAVQARSALRASEEKFSKAFHSSPDAILITELQTGRIVDVNAGFEERTGFTREEAVGQTTEELGVWANRIGREQLLAPLRAEGRLRDLEIDLKVKSGEIRNCLLSAEIIDIGGGSYIITVTRDVTEQKHSEQKRVNLEAQLRQSQKMQAIGQLTGGVAHDFNNILASIMGYTGLALERFDGDVPKELTRYLKEVYRAGERGRDLIAQMLAFSRTGYTERKPCAVAPIVEEAAKLVRATLPSSIETRWQCEQGVPMVMVDPIQLHQVILNLCINARDATIGGGTIDVRLLSQEGVSATCDSCHHPLEGDFVELSVTDTGQGVDERIKDRIFEPFFTTKDVGQGTGMGLSVIHGIVHDAGGHLLVDSSGSGSRFRVLLPPIDPTARTEADVSRGDIQSDDQAGSGHILVVDDDESVATLMTELLVSRGFRVTTRTRCEDAYQLLRANPEGFDLVVTDQTMPGMTGVELAQASMRLRPQLPVVLCTGHGDPIYNREAQKLGVRACFSKPIDVNKFFAEVKGLLGN